MAKRPTAAPWDPTPEEPSAKPGTEAPGSVQAGQGSADSSSQIEKRASDRSTVPPISEELGLPPDEAEAYFQPSADDSFWGPELSHPRLEPAKAREAEPLSGSAAEMFDSSTGWNLEAVTGESSPVGGGSQDAPFTFGDSSPDYTDSFDAAEPVDVGSSSLFGEDGFFSLSSDHEQEAESAPSPVDTAARSQEDSTSSQGEASASPRPPRPPQGLRGPRTPSPVLRLSDSAEFEFNVGSDLDIDPLGDDIFSSAAVPAISPELLCLSVEEALVRSAGLVEEGEPVLGLSVLLAAQVMAPDHEQLGRALQETELHVMSKFCPNAQLDRVPVLCHPVEQLLPVTDGHQGELVQAIDGSRCLSELRSALPGVDPAVFWADMGKLLQRGWLRWKES